MGKKSKTSESSKQTSTSTSTPNVPDWLSQTTMGLNSKIQELGARDPLSFVPGASQLQQQAYQGASTWNPTANYGDIPQVQAASLLEGLQNYMSPYTNDVVNTTLAGFDENAGRTRAQQAAQMAATGSFRGSRAGVREGITEGELARERAGTEAQLRDAAFTTGAGLSNQDAGRRQSASEANASQALELANSRTAAEQARLGLLGNMGQTQYQQDYAQAQAPLDLLKTQTGLFAGLNPSSYFGQTTNASGSSQGTSTTRQSDPLGTLGQMAQVASIFASDRRLKRDIVEVGTDDHGHKWYDFKYLWSDTVHRGLMAQDLLEKEPWRVIEMPNGFYAVNYAGLEPI